MDMYFNHISNWKICQVLYGIALEEIASLFVKHNLCFMPIKGAYLIMSGLASHISERKMVDIDLLIPEDRFSETCEWFGSLENVNLYPDTYGDFEVSFFYALGRRKIYVEFHRLINFSARFILPNKDIFMRGKKVEEGVIFPDITDVLLIHICHMLTNVIYGYNKLAFDEISIYHTQPDFSWQHFWMRAEATGIIAFITLILQIYQKKHAVTIPFLYRYKKLYVKFIVWSTLFITLKNRLFRRILLEIPFVRDAFWLFKYKVSHNWFNLN